MRISFYFFLSLFLFQYTDTPKLYSQEGTLENSLPFKIRWPIQNKKWQKISSTFGESRYDHFHTGLDIPVHGIPVNPISDAKVLWVKKSQRRLGEAPFGGGNTVVLQHGVIWSGYMHLKKIQQETFSKENISSDDLIGLSGKTGHSGGSHLHFFIFNFKLSLFYNPLLFIDKTIIKDTKAPKLKHYRVTSAQDKEHPVHKNIAENTLLARIEDRGIGSEKWGIYYLNVYDKQKKLLKHLKFDTIQFLDHHWVTSDKNKFDEVYHGNRYILHKFANKKIQWTAGGFYGPSLTEIR